MRVIPISVIGFCLALGPFTASGGECGWRLPIEALIGEGTDGKYGLASCGEDCNIKVYRATTDTTSWSWEYFYEGETFAPMTRMSAHDHHAASSVSGNSVTMHVTTDQWCNTTSSTDFSTNEVYRTQNQINHSYRDWDISDVCATHEVDGNLLEGSPPPYCYSWAGTPEQMGEIVPCVYDNWEQPDGCGDESTRKVIFQLNFASSTGQSRGKHIFTWRDTPGLFDEYTTGEMISKARSCAYNWLGAQSFDNCGGCGKKPIAYADIGPTWAGFKISRWRLPVTGTSSKKWYVITLTWKVTTIDGKSYIEDPPEERRIKGKDDELWYYPSAGGEVVSPFIPDEICNWYVNRKMVAARINESE